jgi:virulence-associated protein VapD
LQTLAMATTLQQVGVLMCVQVSEWVSQMEWEQVCMHVIRVYKKKKKFNQIL